jgi:LDH2 family malate/lactate/ureidoglycolate dehydrogenase
MKITIKNARKYIEAALYEIGFHKEDIQAISENILEAEFAGKSNLGMNYLSYLHRHHTVLDPFNMDEPEPTLLTDLPSIMLIDGHKRVGHYVMEWALKKAVERAKSNGIVAFGFTNTHPTIGYVSQYARMVVENGLIFMSFANSNGRVAPYGSVTRLWGTNPITYGIPGKSMPVIYDAATSAITASDIMAAKRDGRKIPNDRCIDAEGNLCTDPVEIWEKGAILPFGGHKGSGLSFIVELLAGALTGSKVGNSVAGDWGVFSIVIDPSKFRSYEDFISNVESAIAEVKQSVPRKGFEKVYVPGEKSQLHKQNVLKEGSIEVDDVIFSQLCEQFKSIK